MAKEMKEEIVIRANHNDKEIYSPNRRYVALLHESKRGYVVCPVDKQEDGEHIDTDYCIGWIGHQIGDEGFYLHDVTVQNFKLNLAELTHLVSLCCLGATKITESKIR